MDVHLAQELLNELGSSLENLETQQAALLQFLKDKGIVTDEQLAPYLNQAGNASSVRWRAAHARLEHLFSAAQKERQSAAQKEQQTAKEERKRAGTQVPRNQPTNKDSEEPGKPTEATMKPPASDKAARKKEEKSESAEARVQASQSAATTHEGEQEPSPQRGEKDAA